MLLTVSWSMQASLSKPMLPERTSRSFSTRFDFASPFWMSWLWSKFTFFLVAGGIASCGIERVAVSQPRSRFSTGQAAVGQRRTCTAWRSRTSRSFWQDICKARPRNPGGVSMWLLEWPRRQARHPDRDTHLLHCCQRDLILGDDHLFGDLLGQQGLLRQLLRLTRVKEVMQEHHGGEFAVPQRVELIILLLAQHDQILPVVDGFFQAPVVNVDGGVVHQGGGSVRVLCKQQRTMIEGDDGRNCRGTAAWNSVKEGPSHLQ